MQQYFETLQDESGNALSGATLTVTTYPGGSAVTIYSTNGTSSPIGLGYATTDVTGQLSFFIPDGAYIFTYAYAGSTYKIKSPVQIADPMAFVVATDTGAANAYVISSSALPVSLYNGLKIEFQAANTSTGASTLNLNSTGAYSIKLPGGVALSTGAIVAGGRYRVEWDTSEWQLVGYVSQPYYGISAAETAAGVTPSNYSSYYGAFSRYGASPSTADNGVCITNALLCNAVVYDDYVGLSAIYPVQTTIVFQAAGQILKGRGFGDTNTGTLSQAPTVLKYTGTAGGVMISDYLSSQTTNWSEIQITDMKLDGNALANVGIQLYNNAVTSGAWRHQIQRVAVVNVTYGSSPTGIACGAGTVNANANDFDLADCFIYGNGIGVSGGGATMGLRRTTIGGSTTYGLNLTQGAYCFADQCIFSQNAQDVNTAALGIQQFSADSCWFENSTNGIYIANGSHAAMFDKCVLNTSNSSFLMNWNSNAGNCAVTNCSLASGSSSTKIINHNANYDYNYIASVVTTDTNYKLRCPAVSSDLSHTGFVVNDNSDFLYGLSSTTGTVTGNGTVVSLNNSSYPVTVDHDYSYGGVAAATGLFTAQCAGVYVFECHVELGGITSAITEAYVNLVITGTYAQTYEVTRTNPYNNSYSNQAHLTGVRSVRMAKGDTASMAVEASGGTQIVTILSGTSSVNFRTSLHGRLA